MELLVCYFHVFLQKPFLDRAEHLTEDVVSVFPVAESLEQYVISVIASSLGEDGVMDYCRKKLALFQVGDFLLFSKPCKMIH